MTVPVTDDDREPAVSGEETPTSPELGNTYSEFISYAAKRRTKVSRARQPSAPVAPKVVSWQWDHRQLIVVGVALAFFLGVILLVFGIGSGVGKSLPPEWVQLHKQRLSAWMNLPKPQQLGQVPDTWIELKLGTKRGEISMDRLVKYDSPAGWADVAFVPDLSKPEAFFGLSFHQDRLYKIAVRLGEDSMVATAPYAASGTVAYGPPRGYEYLTAGGTHIVTIFQTGSRALKLDSVRRNEELYLCEVTLVDLEVGTARELERARTKG
jgi:hypothetical protein